MRSCPSFRSGGASKLSEAASSGGSGGEFPSWIRGPNPVRAARPALLFAPRRFHGGVEGAVHGLWRPADAHARPGHLPVSVVDLRTYRRCLSTDIARSELEDRRTATDGCSIPACRVHLASSLDARGRRDPRLVDRLGRVPVPRAPVGDAGAALRAFALCPLAGALGPYAHRRQSPDAGGERPGPCRRRLLRLGLFLLRPVEAAPRPLLVEDFPQRALLRLANDVKRPDARLAR